MKHLYLSLLFSVAVFTVTAQNLHFVVYGDTRTGLSTHQTVCGLINNENPQLVINGGDLWDGYTTSQFMSCITSRANLNTLLSQNKYLVARGNHETESAVLAVSPTILRNNSINYSFVQGNIFFVCVGIDAGANTTWLSSELSKPEAISADYRIVFAHYPVYSSGGHPVDGVAAVESICDEKDVTFFFSGHSHNYDRTKVMYNRVAVDATDDIASTVNGTVYVVTGGGGAGLYTVATKSWQKKAVSAYHYMVLDAYSDRVEVRVKNSSGTQIDYFVRRKEGATSNQAPAVSISSPVNNATFTAPANITINATASDADGTVSKVEFYQGTTKLGEDLTSPYSLTWSSVAAGTYSLTAKAYDNAGSITTSSAINVIVNGTGNQAPVVSITSPAHGSTFTVPANITISASASDPDGSISKVEFYQGSTKIGEDLTSPYSYTWSSVAAGNYGITAKATDNGGAITTSSPITVTVNAASGTPVTVSKRIATGMDDVEEGTSGSIYTNSSDLELVYDGTTYGNQNIGLRFTGLNIPQGSTITKAYIQFTCDEKKTGATSVTIKGETVDNSAAFTTGSRNVSNRVKTTASVAWNSIPSWNTIGAATTNERTPEMKSIVQEIVNRSGFSTSSAMSFIITGTGTRTAEAYEGSASQAALLYIEYTTPVQPLGSRVWDSNAEQATEIIEVDSQIQGVLVYPNPTSGMFTFKHSGNEVTNLDLYNTQGKHLQHISNANESEVINIDNYLSGIYILQVTQGRKKMSVTIIKE